MTGSPFAYTSPALQTQEDRALYECPVGYVLREAPHVYDILDRCSMAERMTPTEAARVPQYMQRAMRLYGSEVNRLSALRDSSNVAARDAKAAERATRGRR
jgi:hypothetical protein